MHRPPVPISAVLITRNAQRTLAPVLRALGWCAEVVVVDSGSTDGTVRLAEELGARVLHRPFDGYGPQKQFAVSQARHNWVLCIDADEVVTPELRAEVANVVAQPAHYVGYYVPVTLVFLGRVMRYGGEHKRPQLKLFNRQHGTFTDARVHETVALAGPVGKLSGQLLHYSYASLHEYFEKFNRYTTAGAEELLARGKRGAAWQVVTRFPLTFLKEYFLKLNVLNGYAGFVWALFSAVYPVAKYAKLAEMQQRSEHQPETAPGVATQ